MVMILEEHTLFLDLIRNTFILLGTGIIVISVLVGFLITRGAFKDVEVATKTARDISSGGALDQRIQVESKDDEIENLVQAFNTMLNHIHVLVTEVKEIGGFTGVWKPLILPVRD